MKELTIEQKAKRYDEAIKIAKSKIKNDKDHLLYEEDIVDVFPELNETDDDRVRKALIKYFNAYTSYSELRDDITAGDVIAWLEKQGEQNPNPYSGTSFIYNNHTWGMCARDGGIDILCDSKLIKHIGEQKPDERKEFVLASFGTDIKLENDTIIIPEGCAATIDGNKIHIKREYKTATETIKEEKVDKANKVEPKFKIGNWYQCTKDFFGKGVTFDKNTAYYCAKEGCLQDEYGCHIAIVKDLYDNFKLWSIQDAKDGDVLVHSSFMFGDFIFIYNNTSILQAYWNRFIIEDRGHYCPWNMQEVKPATKEQCALLFNKMKEAGYEWDDEKKQLIRIY